MCKAQSRVSYPVLGQVLFDLQVSKSWRVLSEDELIWCRICHSLGRETIYTTREKQNWKQIVRHNIERQRLLIANWKVFTIKAQKKL